MLTPSWHLTKGRAGGTGRAVLPPHKLAVTAETHLAAAGKAPVGQQVDGLPVCRKHRGLDSQAPLSPWFLTV